MEHFNSDKLAKYIRCVFQTLLPLDDALAFQMLDHALQVASETKQVDQCLLLVLCKLTSWLTCATPGRQKLPEYRGRMARGNNFQPRY